MGPPDVLATRMRRMISKTIKPRSFATMTRRRFSARLCAARCLLLFFSRHAAFRFA